MSTTFTVNPHPAKNVSFFGDAKETKTDAAVVGRSPPSPFSTEPSENGFVHTVCAAYNNHHDLVLRPDNVWLAILIQFACYVEHHAEELRKVFVNHEGKKQLEVSASGTLRNAPYDEMAIAMTDQIAANLKDDTIREWAMPNFSTTTLTDKVVGAITLMAAVKKYFSYKWSLCCGLTNVTMAGTVEDWENVEKRVQRLLEFDNKSNYMKKWVSLLAPVCAQFTASAKGTPDLEWWKRVCSHHGNGSGPRYLSGWITSFCAFSTEGNWVGDKRSVRSNWGSDKYADVNSYAPEGWIIIDTNDIPTGSVRCDVELDDNGTTYQCELLAGHSGSAALNKTTLAPHVSWLFRIKPEPELNQKKGDMFDQPPADHFC